MSDKVRLLELANKKVADDSDFIAYFFTKYSEIEKKSQQEIISTLNCSFENYYKVGLCRIPDINETDFLQRLNNISQYSNISSLELNKIIKRVNSVLKFSDNINLQNTSPFLMAARDKKKKDKKKE
jgi:hypothetical protein